MIFILPSLDASSKTHKDEAMLWTEKLSDKEIQQMLKELKPSIKGDNADLIRKYADLLVASSKGVSTVKKAASLYQKAADMGNLIAQRNYARLLLDGSIISKDLEKAKKYFSKFQSILMQVAKSGIINKNTASRKISRISKKISIK